MTEIMPPGNHLLIDFFEAKNLTDLEVIRDAMMKASDICGATVLDVKLHHFGEGHGVTGVAVLAESHMSIHTWPELNYAALDVFMCGACDPTLALPLLRKVFQPERENVIVVQRGKE